MSMTLPQIIMLNHAAWVNSKRADERADRKPDEPEEDKDPVVFMGKRFSQMTSDDMVRYYGTVDQVTVHDSSQSLSKGTIQ